MCKDLLSELQNDTLETNTSFLKNIILSFSLNRHYLVLIFTKKFKNMKIISLFCLINTEQKTCNHRTITK